MPATHQPPTPVAATTSPTVRHRTVISRTPAPARRAALSLLYALLLVALVARAFFLLWEPPFTGAVDYDAVAPLGESFWAMNIYVGGPSFAVTWVALAIFVALLARGRSTAVTLAGAVLIGLGGTVFALVITAEVLPFAYAADTDIFAEAQGRALFTALNANLDLLVPVIIGTQAVVALGVLVALLVALLTRALPRWLCVTGLIYLVAFAVLPYDELPRGVLIASDLLQALLVAGIGWFGLRAGLAGHPPRL